MSLGISWFLMRLETRARWGLHLGVFTGTAVFAALPLGVLHSDSVSVQTLHVRPGVPTLLAAFSSCHTIVQKLVPADLTADFLSSSCNASWSCLYSGASSWGMVMRKRGEFRKGRGT